MNSLWVSAAAIRGLVDQANRAYPLETGGVLVGYFADNGEPVVLNAVGPGPAATHRRYRFLPDHAWQCEQLDFLFEQSKGALTYMGDWHTHPNGIPRMSWLDRRTLRSIARHPDAKVPRPLMLIGGGSPQNWDWLGHQYRGERLHGLITECDAHKLRLFQSD